MTKVVDLSGKPVEESAPIDSDDCLVALKALVAKIESGDIAPPTRWMFFMAVQKSGDEKSWKRLSLSSKMPITVAVFELEFHKAELMAKYLLSGE